MTTKKSILFCLFLFVISCKPHPKVQFINKSLDSSTVVTEISMRKLARDYKSYQGKYVQIEGTFYDEFENVSICVNRGLNSDCFWLDFNGGAIDNYDLLGKVTTKKVIIKGRVDTTSKGHLSYYLATLRDIYYFKEK